MTLLFVFLFIPVVIALIAKFAFKLDISYREFGAQIVAGCLSVLIVWSIGAESATWDREVWNGAVTRTRMYEFSCPMNTLNPCTNSYSCNCRQVYAGTDSNGRARYRTECDTCYVYPWERNWEVYSNVWNGNMNIRRIDAQGAQTPPRWAAIRPGDPVSTTNGYQNWVRAASSSLFNESPEADSVYEELLVDYPIEIVDYYRLDRVVTPNVELRNEREWNRELANSLSRLGPSRQMNMVFVITKDTQRDYAFAMRRHWRGFKKNDAIVFIGLDASGNITWSETMSWSRNELFNIEMRAFFEERIGQSFAALNPRDTMAQVEEISLLFERRPMHEFEYLRGDIPPPTWLLILATILSVGGGIGLSIFFHRNEVFESVRSYYGRL